MSNEQYQIQNTLQKLPDSETANWQGKTTDWLGRTYDVNNSGKEYEDKDLITTSSTGWIKPDKLYVMGESKLVQNEMKKDNGWEKNGYEIAKKTLLEASLTESQRQYFYDYNYVPRSIEHFDVTGDGVTETVVTSLPLGCGACADFFMTIFTDSGIYNFGTDEGTIVEAESQNGFYLINRSYLSKNTRSMTIRKYVWNNGNFIMSAKKEIQMTPTDK